MSTALAEIQGAVRQAATSRVPLCIRGRGTWTSAYRHAAASTELSLWNYAGVQEYVPGNLAITVRAGTTLSEIAEIADAENQWFPLDPFGDKNGTIGAAVATCSYGPLATGFGTPRDLVLGVEAVLGSGETVRGGGRVVKNVAGYDLTRLFTGSWGTLGVITEVTLRLFGKQETSRSIVLPLPEKRDAADKLVQAIRSAAVVPWAMEILDSKLARTLGAGESAALLLRFGGNEKLVSAQIAAIETLAESSEAPAEFWQAFAGLGQGWSVRLSGLPSRLFESWDAAGRLAALAGTGFRVAAPDRGTVRIFFPEDTDTGKLFTAFGQFTAANNSALRIVAEAVPSVSPLSTRARGDAYQLLASGIKKVFDPRNILNRGLLQQ